MTMARDKEREDDILKLSPLQSYDSYDRRKTILSVVQYGNFGKCGYCVFYYPLNVESVRTHLLSIAL